MCVSLACNPNLCVINTVGSEHMKEISLLDVVSFPEHDMISVGPVHIQVNLSHFLAVLSTQVSGKMRNIAI